MKTLARLCASLLAAACMSSPALANTWPNKPIKLIVAQPAGSSPDTTARQIALKLSDVWGEQMVVENKAGANGNIGMQAVATAPADGYTVGLGVPSNMTINPFLYKMPFNPLQDLVPVAQIGSVPFALVVNPKLPVHNVKELVAYAKSLKGEMNYSSAGIGNIGHLAAELLADRGGFSMHHIPNKGDAPALQDVMAGQTQVMFVGIPAVAGHARSGRLRLIAVGGTQRLPAFPDVPTIQEAGAAFNDVVIQGWNGIVAPAGTPREVINKMAQDVAKVLDSKEVRDQITTSTGLVVKVSSPDEFNTFIRAESSKWGKLISALNIKVQ